MNNIEPNIVDFFIKKPEKIVFAITNYTILQNNPKSGFVSKVCYRLDPY